MLFMKALLVIYSCRKYSFMHNYYIEKYTNMNYDVFVAYGDTLENDYDIDYENNLIKLNCNDSFDHLVNKTNLLLNVFLKEFSNYDYLIKMDDDTELNLDYESFEKLEILNNDYMGHKLIKSMPQNHDYHFGKCNNLILNSKPYELEIELSWGAGYFYILSKNIIETVCDDIKNYPDLLNENLYEDMLIGYIMLNNNIEFKEILPYEIITNLSRPRITSITNLLILTNPDKVIYNRNSKNIKKISLNYNRSDDTNNNVEEKIKRELDINNDLNKKIVELQDKIKNRNQEPINIDFNVTSLHINTRKTANKTPIKRILLRK
jgi:hypothetical protein